MAWRQTGEEVTLEAACPRELSRKDVVCLFTTHSVHLEAAGHVIADGQLFAPIAPDECCWEFGGRPCLRARMTAPAVYEGCPGAMHHPAQQALHGVHV